MRPLALLLTAPFLLGAVAPDICDSGREGGVHIAPVPIVDIAVDPIPIVDHAVVAHEVVQIATRGWLLGSELRVPGPERLVYPAGTPLDPRYCLPAAYAPFVPAPEGQRWRRVGGYVQACLADRDGDGLHEALNLFAGDSAMHVPVRHLERSETLAVPQALAEDPLGLADSRRYVHRRVTVTVKDNIARLAIAHAFQDQDRHAALGVYVTGSDGAYVYRLVPRPPHPVSMTGNSYFGSGRDAEASVTIADGAEVAVGGLAFRIDHYSHGFTLQPLASRSPRWVHYGCGGTSILLGPAPKTPLDSAPTPR